MQLFSRTPDAPVAGTTSLSIYARGSKRVTRDQLRGLPEPVSMGRLHRPIPHHQLIDVIEDQLFDRNWAIKRGQYGINQGGKALFGVMDLHRIPDLARETPESGTFLSNMGHSLRKSQDEVQETPEMGTSFGFRSSTNSTVAIRAVAGGRVFVCDNLVLSGAEFVLQQKSTIRLNLQQKVSLAIDKFITQSKVLIEDIEALKNRALADNMAQSLLYKVFSKGILPAHLLDDVDLLYFKPQDAHTDCQPRTAWGLHNACTRAAKSLNPSMQFNSTMRLGQLFDLAKTAPALS